MRKINENEVKKNLLKKLDPNFRKDIQCIIFYGSRAHGVETDYSDFDFFMIMKPGSKYGRKSATTKLSNITFVDEENKSFEDKCTVDVSFEIATIHEIILELKERVARKDYYLYSAICLGKIIYGEECKILVQNLSDYIKEEYLDNLEPNYKDKEILNERIKIENAINRIDNQRNYASEEYNNFNFYYYNLLEKIRTFYCNCYGYPTIQPYRVLRIYQDKDYKKSVFGNIEIAEEDFIKLYLRCSNTKFSNEEIKEILEVKNKESFENLFKTQNEERWKFELEEIVILQKKLKNGEKNIGDKIYSIKELWKFVTKNMENLDIKRKDGAVYQYKKY